LSGDRFHRGKVPGIDAFQFHLFAAPFRYDWYFLSYYHRYYDFSPGVPESTCHVKLYNLKEN